MGNFENLKHAVKQCYQTVGQEFIKMPKIANFDEFLKTLIFSETVLPDKSVFQKTKISGKCQYIENSNATFLSDFQTLWSRVLPL